MFQKATRFKLRFDSPKGLLSTEDLWDLPLQSANPLRPNLDDVARSLHLQLKSGADVSFVDAAKKSDPTIQLKFDLVKHIIDTRLAENAAAAAAAANKEKKQHLLGILAQKENEALAGQSIDELRAAIAAL